MRWWGSSKLGRRCSPVTARHPVTTSRDRQNAAHIETPPARESSLPPWVPLVTIGAVIAISVAVRSGHAMLSVVFDGAAALAVMGPPMLMGLALVPLVFPKKLPMRWHLLLGAALGLGLTSLLVLLLGLAGLFHRGIWLGLFAVFMMVGLLRWQTLRRGDEHAQNAERAVKRRGAGWFVWLLLLVCPFASVAILSATNAPGMIWEEEGYAYDVLTYHLQLPKEYFHAGRISYLPHNVYANFPSNVEMLYLLTMILVDDAHDAAVPANMIHLLLAALTVFAAWVAGREWSPRAAVVCAVATASTGWLAYLSGLAYVENGMLFFAMVSAAWLVRCYARSSAPNGVVDDTSGAAERQSRTLLGGNRQAMIVGGVLAGFSFGCKYTAGPMLVIPLAIVPLVCRRTSTRSGPTDAIVFAFAALVAVSPWLVKNLALTGNPVFPLVNEIFHASPAGWGEDETDRWNAAHRVEPEDRTLSARASTMWNRTMGDRFQRFGPMLILLGALGLIGRRWERFDWALVAMLLVQLAIWAFATHLFGRFAVVTLIPLVLLAGRSLLPGSRRIRVVSVVALLIAGSAWNSVCATRLHEAESIPGAPAALFYEGHLPQYAYFRVVNEELPDDARLLVVGDAKAFYFNRPVEYCVVFNRNPFFTALMEADSPAAMLDWLRDRGITHVLVNWSEMRRLDATYGFSPAMPPPRLAGLIDRLTDAGLTLLHRFPLPGSTAPYVHLYEVPK